MTRHIHVLFLCTGNSARSILSEALLNDLGGQDAARKFIGWSAGSHPSGQPHPDGLAELRAQGHSVGGYRSKSWDEFAAQTGGLSEMGKSDANISKMDIIVTVCDNAAGELCPVFYGSGVKVHWPQADPAHIEPLAARRAAFARCYRICKARIEALLALPDEALSDPSRLQAISQIKA